MKDKENDHNLVRQNMLLAKPVQTHFIQKGNWIIGLTIEIREDRDSKEFLGKN